MDSLKDGNACRRDAALMAQLGINTIYVMAIDPSENHDDCFSIFNSVGIYVMVALRTNGIFQYSYNDFVNSYTADKMKGTFEVIDAVKDYENLLGFDMGLMPNMYEFGIEGNTMSYSDGEKLYRVSTQTLCLVLLLIRHRPSSKTPKNTFHAMHLDLSWSA